MNNWKTTKDRPPLGLSMGVVYQVVNNDPNITTSLTYNAILQWCEGVRKDDPFCVVYVLGHTHTWFKGEYCYSNQRYKFTPVGLAAVPDVILMMEICQP